MLHIRKATKADAPLIALLARITFSEAFGHLFRDKTDLLQYYEQTFSVSKIEHSLQKETNVFWIAFYDALPVGYAKLKLNSPSSFLTEPQICQLQKIYLLQDFLSKKIGQKLQALVLEEAQKQGFETIWLSVFNGNIRAIKFYEKHQFKAIGTHDFQIGKENFDFTAMAKDLNELTPH